MGLGEPVRELPAEFRADTLPAGVGDVEVFCPGCLVVGGAPVAEEPRAAQRLAAAQAFADWPLVVVSDEPKRTAASTINFLWTTFTRFEPAADIHSADARIVRNHISHSFPIVVDARRQPGFPAELFCSPEIAERVTRRWREYFPRGVEMGDSDAAHLDRIQ